MPLLNYHISVQNHSMDKKDREGAELGEPDDGEMPQKKIVGLER